MGGMDMGGANSSADSSSMDDMMGGCKISMLLNYNTIDACFISENWRITSAGMFAGSCIGVVLLGIFLELLRRSVREWDRYIVRQHIAKHTGLSRTASPASAASHKDQGSKTGARQGERNVAAGVRVPPFRPKLWQHGVRAVLHTAQFTVAYFIMLLGKLFSSPELQLLTIYRSHVLQRLHPRQHLPRHSCWQSIVELRDSLPWVRALRSCRGSLLTT